MTSRRAFLAALTATLASPRFSWEVDAVPVLLDHILLGCSDLDRGIAFVEERVGVRAEFGGVHPGRGTQNALLSLGARHYLEIIAPDPKQAGPNASQGLRVESEVHQLRELNEPRLLGWSAHPGNLDDFTADLRRAGIAFQGPWPGSRRRPDGRLLQWKALALVDDRGGVLPFFIEWAADSIHPSEDAPRGAKLTQFSIAGPTPTDLAAVCKSLNLDVTIEQSETPQLRASFGGHSGKVMNVTS